MTGRSSRSVERVHNYRRRRSRGQSRERCTESNRSSDTPPLSRRDDRSTDYRNISNRNIETSRNAHRPREGHDRSHSRRCGSVEDISLDRILNRLDAIENRLQQTITTPTVDSPSHLYGEQQKPSSSPSLANKRVPGITGGTTLYTLPGINASTTGDKDMADRIAGALSSLIQVRSHSFYISPFDPNVHDFDMWCAEVDRGRQLNNWDDRECLGRIGGCLRGDAKSWLNDWVTHDRTWSNFKTEFRSLCPRNIDFATVLYEVMCTSSHKYSTYAEYARRSLLRLNIVRGLSDELKVAIVIKGIVDPQVKAAATNAKLPSKNLVEFLSNYTKPKHDFRSSSNARPSINPETLLLRKRNASRLGDNVTCLICGKFGHKKWYCPKKQKLDTTDSQTTTTIVKPVPKTFSNSHRSSKYCTFCKRNGHLIESCFFKQRSEGGMKNSSDVNFCSDPNQDSVM